MTRIRALLPALLSIALTAPAAAQEYAIDHCDTPRVPLGLLDGGGTVRYRLAKNGRPDTASIEVLTAEGLSAGAVRSAVVRQLSACRLTRPDEERVLVQQRFRFSRQRVDVAPAHPADPEIAALEIVPAPIPESAVLDSAGNLEEHPRPLECRNNRPTPLSEPPGGSSRAEAEAAFDRWSSMNSGTVRFQLYLTAAGKVVPDSSRVLQSDNPNITNGQLQSAYGCTFAPGRIGGVAVATRFTMGGGVRNVRVGP